MPCHHNLETYLHAYLEGSGIASDPKGALFRTIGRVTGQLTTTPLPQQNAHAMIRRRAAGADITTQVGNHTFRATGITAYLKNGGSLENAAAMANHASTRTLARGREPDLHLHCDRPPHLGGGRRIPGSRGRRCRRRRQSPPWRPTIRATGITNVKAIPSDPKLRVLSRALDQHGADPRSCAFSPG
jgi:hypothetical protein